MWSPTSNSLTRAHAKSFWSENDTRRFYGHEGRESGDPGDPDLLLRADSFLIDDLAGDNFRLGRPDPEALGLGLFELSPVPRRFATNSFTVS